MESVGTPVLWIGFTIFVLAMLAIDLGVFHRKAHEVRFKEAMTWTFVWITISLLFNVLVWYWFGPVKGLEFLTAYVIEKALSVDNIFVFIVLFTSFAVPKMLQHRVLFWGVLGALVFRAIFIVLGAALLNRFHWMLYVFGALLLITGIKMLVTAEEEVHPENNPMYRFAKRFIPTVSDYEGGNFFTVRNGKRFATPLLLVLIAVEASDIVFAVDSIPAIFAITNDPFIIYTSNVFAILGLRSLYFLLAGVVEKFHYLKIGLAIVLTFVGVKMLGEGFVHQWLDKESIIGISLGVVALVLIGSVVASLIWPQQAETHVEVQLPPDFNSPFDDDQGRLGADEPQG